MKKIIKRKIRISTRTRDFVDYVNHEFYSHDKHNAFFEFTMEQLPTENIIGLFYFQKTKRYLEKRATVEGNTFTIEFDTSLITTDETVIGFIYFEKVVQSADVHQFSFGVKVSEIDKMQDVPIQEESSKRIVALEDIVTKAELKELFKNIERNGGSTPIDTSNFATAKSVEAIEERVRTIESKEDHDTIYNDEEIKRRLDTLESKTDNFISGVSVSKESNNVTLTYTYVDGQSKNVSFTDSDTINVAYDDSALRERLKNLEERPQIDVSEFAKKTDIPPAYNDSELSRRVSTLETKEDKDTVYNDEEIKRRLDTLESKTDNFVSGVSVSKEGSNVTLTYTYVDGSSKNVSFTDSDTINVAYDDSALTERVKALENRPATSGTDYAQKIADLEAKAGYEIHGTGMPNGQVKAPIGTTYVDMEVTNGALKWIKRTGTGNTGWQVFTGDTGWRTLPLEQKRGTARLQIRRINDQVIVKFDGLQWGWFGVNDIEKLGGSVVEKTIGGKKYTWIKLSVGRGVYVLPEGFRSASSLLSGLYGDLGDLLGSVYVGGTADSNAIQLRYAMERNALTSNILSQIRISPITFITDDDWPTTLP